MMSTKMQIQTFNQKLVNENVEINIIDYVNLLNNESYHIDISFIDDFVELVCNDECCIHHNVLYKYGVLSEHDTHDVKRVLEQYKFTENVYYLANREDAVMCKGGKHKQNYILHPDTFKECLYIKIINGFVQGIYYIVLE